MTYVEYSSNNSGGSWWLSDADWKALEEAGWEVDWYKDEEGSWADADGRWLGALASRATRRGLSLRDAILEWESITGEDAAALGCNCCGTPHNFYEYNDDDSMTNMWSPSYPTSGDRDF